MTQTKGILNQIRHYIANCFGRNFIMSVFTKKVDQNESCRDYGTFEILVQHQNLSMLIKVKSFEH